MKEIERREDRSNIILQMACGKEKGQPTVVFRDMLVHHEKPEVFGTMRIHIFRALLSLARTIALCRGC